MPKPSRQNTLTIKIDADLAKQYRAAYVRAFGTAADLKKPIEDFIAGFVEDRLAEEIAFVEEEAGGVRK